uniref:Ovule protein n=1 Tax=Heterorhabditis bacteriophora TaxID=37862 RepID=A0A1I7WGJ1_HETBA
MEECDVGLSPSLSPSSASLLMRHSHHPFHSSPTRLRVASRAPSSTGAKTSPILKMSGNLPTPMDVEDLQKTPKTSKIDICY